MNQDASLLLKFQSFVENNISNFYKFNCFYCNKVTQALIYLLSLNSGDKLMRILLLGIMKNSYTCEHIWLAHMAILNLDFYR